MLEKAGRVVIIPGYGMAVAQAQHRVRELYDQLRQRGATVKFAIHPVAGRMPGHMNVLLAEAEIPYTDLVEMDEINPEMPQTDVALVIGANDVVNPAARHDKASPIYGMPIIDADKAKTVFAIKRSMNPGFAGIDNELYFDDQHGCSSATPRRWWAIWSNSLPGRVGCTEEVRSVRRVFCIESRQTLAIESPGTLPMQHRDTRIRCREAEVTCQMRSSAHLRTRNHRRPPGLPHLRLDCPSHTRSTSRG